MASAFTSNWMWGQINETLDVNVDSGGTQTTRNNWTATRYRYTNETYVSELGDESSVLGAYRGSEYYERYTNPVNYISFDTTRNWTDTTYKYYQDYTWTVNGVNAYFIGDDFTNKPDDTKITIVRPILRYDTTNWWWRWECGEWTAGDEGYKDISIVSVPVAYPTSSPANRIATDEFSGGSGGSPTNPATPENYQFKNVFGTFVGISDCTNAGLTQPVDWYCSNDTQDPIQAVDWYKQTQTWIYKDEYA